MALATKRYQLEKKLMLKIGISGVVDIFRGSLATALADALCAENNRRALLLPFWRRKICFALGCPSSLFARFFERPPLMPLPNSFLQLCIFKTNIPFGERSEFFGGKRRTAHLATERRPTVHALLLDNPPTALNRAAAKNGSFVRALINRFGGQPMVTELKEVHRLLPNVRDEPRLQLARGVRKHNP